MLGTFDSPALRRAMVDGYERLRPLPSSDAIEAGFLAGIYYFMAMHLHNAYIREWYGRRLPVVLADFVDPFARGGGILQQLLE